MAVNASDGNGDVVIDCSDCEFRGTEECRDCVVSWLLDRPAGAIVFDVAQERAIRSLANAGLIPDVRFGRKTG